MKVEKRCVVNSDGRRFSSRISSDRARREFFRSALFDALWPERVRRFIYGCQTHELPRTSCHVVCNIKRSCVMLFYCRERLESDSIGARLKSSTLPA